MLDEVFLISIPILQVLDLCGITDRSHRNHECRLVTHHVQLLVRLYDPLDPRYGEERRSGLFLSERLALFQDPFRAFGGFAAARFGFVCKSGPVHLVIESLIIADVTSQVMSPTQTVLCCRCTPSKPGRCSCPKANSK
jgi:hypothetical protein